MSNGNHVLEIHQQVKKEEMNRQVIITWKGEEYEVLVSGHQEDKQYYQCWSNRQVDELWCFSKVFREYTGLVPTNSVIAMFI